MKCGEGTPGGRDGAGKGQELCRGWAAVLPTAAGRQAQWRWQSASEQVIAWLGSRGGDRSSGSWAERTCLPTAARLEAVDLLQGPLSPAALNPVASVGPTELALPAGGAGVRAWAEGGAGNRAQPRILVHSHANPSKWLWGSCPCFCAGLGTPPSGSHFRGHPASFAWTAHLFLCPSSFLQRHTP